MVHSIYRAPHSVAADPTDVTALVEVEPGRSDRERELDERLPIIPHEWLGADCCGCLMIRLRGEQAEILCNECGASIRTVALGDVESAMAELSQTDEICTATCTHCGAVNRFPGFSAIEAFICSECGEGVVVARQVQ